MTLRRAVVAVFVLAATLACGLLLFSRPTPAEEVSCPEEESGLVITTALSSSDRDEAVQDARLALIRSKLVVGAVCGSPTAVVAYTTGGDVHTIWGSQDELHVEGGSQTARANRVARVVDPIMQDAVVPRYEAAADELPADQSDFLAWPRIADDAIQQLRAKDPDLPIEVYVLSDGVHVDDQIDLNQPLTIEEAADLAASVEAPVQFRRVKVVQIGIGQVAGEPAPSGGEWTEAVRTFATNTCEATGATCTVLATDITQSTGS